MSVGEGKSVAVKPLVGQSVGEVFRRVRWTFDIGEPPSASRLIEVEVILASERRWKGSSLATSGDWYPRFLPSLNPQAGTAVLACRLTG